MKYKQVIILLLICSVILFNSFVLGQKRALPDTVITYVDGEENAISGDTVLQIQSFTVTGGDSIERYKKDKEFAYIKYLDSLLKRSKDLTIDTLSSDNLKGQKKLNRSPGSSVRINSSSANDIFKNPVVKFILLSMAVFFIGFISYRLFFTGGVFKRTGLQQRETAGNPGEIITDSNAFNSLVNEAVANKDYRLATRYLYLQTLQILFTKNLLEFAPDKTNANYAGELINKPYRDEFASLTMNYEYVWYGKFDVDYTLFNRIKNNFKKFQNSI